MGFKVDSVRTERKWAEEIALLKNCWPENNMNCFASFYVACGVSKALCIAPKIRLNDTILAFSCFSLEFSTSPLLFRFPCFPSHALSHLLRTPLMLIQCSSSPFVYQIGCDNKEISSFSVLSFTFSSFKENNEKKCEWFIIHSSRAMLTNILGISFWAINNRHNLM